MGGFNEDLSVETVGAPLPSPPLCCWVRGWVVRVVVYGYCVVRCGLLKLVWWLWFAVIVGFGLHIWVLRFLILCIVCLAWVS